MIRIVTFSVLLAGLGVMTACGSSSSPASPSTPAADVTIQILGDRADQSYNPNPTAMRVGQSVAWHNGDTIAHDATQDAARFATGTLNANATSTPVTMSTAGTFTYHCTIHPGMVGTITVQ
jgi:plastocyanin